MSPWLATQAWLELLYLDLVGLRGFGAVHRVVQRSAAPTTTSDPSSTLTAVLDAVRLASMVYVKPARCLQRSAVVTRLLRRRGVKADMVIGCQLAPVKGHAWVEVEGEVVCEYQEGIEYYHVLDRW